MTKIEELMELIISRANINLREFSHDVGPYVRGMIPIENLWKFYAFYGMTLHHPVSFSFQRSALAGSYFLGNCDVDRSLIYKTDVRGDELKQEGDEIMVGDIKVVLQKDEKIYIKDSFLIKNLVHNFSHDPENLAEFAIRNTVSMHYANIHGASMRGCFLGPYATVDLTSCHDCVVGEYAYVQVGELRHERVDAGEVWIKSGDDFDFVYQFPTEVLPKYISFEKGEQPGGLLIDFVEDRQEDFEEIFGRYSCDADRQANQTAAVSRYAVIKGDVEISENVLIAQRAYIQDSKLGKGANAQENCYIIDSHLKGNNVTAHGGKIIHATMGEDGFVGFNAFLRGSEECPLTVGSNCVIMPHTIMDLEEPLTVPPAHFVWGYIRNQKDFEENSMSMEDFINLEGELNRGNMHFHGSGRAFVSAFAHRIEHILEANGAYFEGGEQSGHAQMGRNQSYNTIEPYPEGEMRGMFPTIRITP
ncbi:transferase [Desulfatibacillum aliphaticivorans]|uniref:Hexapaptide repeat-containing transferase n=1 Tax=Desulfatibacillum aliphaticivorans TaxID=218208 RepID=B8FE56_DESAL|nr:transferase [Desulfatibacillum aliphaticivorans]ACL06837.1 hexapaptide repeat-containing transferase [Desulfatibacillum aliphaticivorans]